MEGAEPASTWWRRWEQHIRFGVWFALYLTAIALAAILIAVIVAAPAVAHGFTLLQAIQPASAPATHWWTWIAANWGWLSVALGYGLINLATGLSDYPEAKDQNSKLAKFIRVLRLLGAAVSWVHFSNVNGTFKILLQPSNDVVLASTKSPTA